MYVCNENASQVDQMVKNMPAMQETWVWPPGQRDPLQKETTSPLQYSCLGNPIINIFFLQIQKINLYIYICISSKENHCLSVYLYSIYRYPRKKRSVIIMKFSRIIDLHVKFFSFVFLMLLFLMKSYLFFMLNIMFNTWVTNSWQIYPLHYSS